MNCIPAWWLFKEFHNYCHTSPNKARIWQERWFSYCYPHPRKKIRQNVRLDLNGTDKELLQPWKGWHGFHKGSALSRPGEWWYLVNSQPNEGQNGVTSEMVLPSQGGCTEIPLKHLPLLRALDSLWNYSYQHRWHWNKQLLTGAQPIHDTVATSCSAFLSNSSFVL